MTENTNATFFENLAAGTYVVAHRDSHVEDDRFGKFLIESDQVYIWTGGYEVATYRGRTHAKLVQANGRNIRRADLDVEAQFTPVMLSDNSIRTLTEYELFLVKCLLVDDKSQEQYTKTLEAKDAEILSLRKDFDIINNLANEAAENRGWCAEYETVLETINEATELVKLTGREYEWEIPVTVTLTYEYTHVVRARSQAEAEDKVGEVDDDEMKSLAQDKDSYPSIDCEVNYHDMTRGSAV